VLFIGRQAGFVKKNMGMLLTSANMERMSAALFKNNKIGRNSKTSHIILRRCNLCNHAFYFEIFYNNME
jgi:hypothetical protein